MLQKIIDIQLGANLGFTHLHAICRQQIDSGITWNSGIRTISAIDINKLTIPYRNTAAYLKTFQRVSLKFIGIP